jgi:hypothetical protein
MKGTGRRTYNMDTAEKSGQMGLASKENITKARNKAKVSSCGLIVVYILENSMITILTDEVYINGLMDVCIKVNGIRIK